MTYHISFREELAEGCEINQQVVKDLLRNRRVSLLLLELSCQVQDLVHDDKEVIAAPFRIADHKLGHDCIDLFNDIHSE